jgi:hypothetical protein
VIAPLRQSDPRSSAAKRSLIRARMAVAAALLPPQRAPSDSRLPLWKSWFWAAWMLFVAIWYLAEMLLQLVRS